MKIFYFTATGNSLAVAKKIGGELISIAQECNKENKIYKDDVIGVVFPTYGCNVPKIVKRFLENSIFEAEYTFAIGTYGKIQGRTMEIVQDIAKEKGYCFDYVNSVLMLDNYQPQFDISQEVSKLPAKKVDEQLENIVTDIQNRKLSLYKSSFVDKIVTWFSGLLNIEKDDYAKNYYVDDKCVLCGICSKVCPMQNISVEERVEFLDHCASCQACIHACPKHAIHFKGECSTERWRNPEVTLAEIIEANNGK